MTLKVTERPELTPVAVIVQVWPAFSLSQRQCTVTPPPPSAVPDWSGPSELSLKAMVSPGLAPVTRPNARRSPEHTKGFSLSDTLSEVGAAVVGGGRVEVGAGAISVTVNVAVRPLVAPTAITVTAAGS